MIIDDEYTKDILHTDVNGVMEEPVITELVTALQKSITKEPKMFDGMMYDMSEDKPTAPAEPFLWVAQVDEVPSLSTEPHEIADPITREEVVQMWNTLKQKYMELKSADDKAGGER